MKSVYIKISSNSHKHLCKGGSKMVDTPKWYDAHLPKFREIAYVKSMDEYQDLYQRSLDDPDGFWSEQARRYLSWVDSI